MLNMVPPEGVSLEVLAVALQSDEFYARYSAAEVLSKRGDREARLILQDVLDHGAAPQRANVAHHLHRLSWFVAEPMLRQAWRDVDYRVHEAAAYALCQMCDANAYNLLTKSLPNRHDDVYMAVAWGVCYTPDARAVPALTLALHATEADVRVKVLEALAATASPSAINVVRGALADPDLDVKYAAMLSFIELQGTTALPEAAEMIKQERGVVRQHLLRGFFHATNYRHVDIVGSGYVEVVIEALAVAVCDELPEARMMAVLPLAWIRHEQAAAVLFEAYRCELNTEVKVYIVQQASSLMSLVSDQLLADALHSSDETLRVAAEEIKRGNMARWQTGD
jgi:HEAT repeat protein